MRANGTGRAPGSDRARRPPTYSTARLDALVCPVLVDSRTLQSCLPPAAMLSLPRLPQVPESRHPIIVEIWRVRDGLIEAGGLTAHAWWELAGASVGLGVGGGAGATLGAGIGGAAGAAGGGALGMWLGPLGWWWGATAGGAVGAATGATMAGAAGATLAAHWTRQAARRFSEGNSRVIGTYNEIIVTVPCRRERADGVGADFAFVLGSYTDSAASVMGERFFGWGYRKLRARGVRRASGTLEVSAGNAAPCLTVATRGAMPTMPAAIARRDMEHVWCALSQPMLGLLAGRRLAVSFLDRSLEHRAVRLTPVSVRVMSTAAFLPGLPGFVRDTPAIGPRDPWGAFSVAGLPVKLSYPRAED